MSTTEKLFHKNKILIICIRNNLEVQVSMPELSDISSQSTPKVSRLVANLSTNVLEQTFLLSLSLLSEKPLWISYRKVHKQVIPSSILDLFFKTVQPMWSILQRTLLRLLRDMLSTRLCKVQDNKFSNL